MVIKEVKHQQIEFVVKKGKVRNAYDSEKYLRKNHPNYRDYGDVDFTDHEVEEAMKRDEKKNRHIKNSKSWLKE